MNSQCYHGSYGACFYDINELNTTNASFQWWNKKNLKILLVRPTCSFFVRVNPYFDWMLISGHMVINLIKLCFWTQSSLLKFGNSVTIVRNWKINIHKTHLISMAWKEILWISHSKYCYRLQYNTPQSSLVSTSHWKC